MFYQVNVAKGGPNMDIAIQQAWEVGADIVMIQEPWTMCRNGTTITKSHPGYNSHIPFGGEVVRPRAITFTRKGPRATQIFPSTERTADYCFVQTSGLTFVNVYRAPGPSGSLEPLLCWQPQGSTVIGGDFNAVSRHWQPHAQRQYGNGDQILEWDTAHGMEIITTIGEPTHQDGNVLDLTWSNASAIASVRPFYHCTSDHSTIEGTVYTPAISDLTGILRQVRVSDSNLDDFAHCVERWARLGQLNSVVDIERCTARLLDVLHDVLSNAMWTDRRGETSRYLCKRSSVVFEISEAIIE